MSYIDATCLDLLEKGRLAVDREFPLPHRRLCTSLDQSILDVFGTATNFFRT